MQVCWHLSNFGTFREFVPRFRKYNPDLFYPIQHIFLSTYFHPSKCFTMESVFQEVQQQQMQLLEAQIQAVTPRMLQSSMQQLKSTFAETALIQIQAQDLTGRMFQRFMERVKSDAHAFMCAELHRRRFLSLIPAEFSDLIYICTTSPKQL